MLTFTKAVKTSDGETFESITDAQAHELEILLGVPTTDGAVGLSMDSVCQLIVNNADKVMDILSTKEGSRVRARKINGGKKTRKPATTETTA